MTVEDYQVRRRSRPRAARRAPRSRSRPSSRPATSRGTTASRTTSSAWRRCTGARPARGPRRPALPGRLDTNRRRPSGHGAVAQGARLRRRVRRRRLRGGQGRGQGHLPERLRRSCCSSARSTERPRAASHWARSLLGHSLDLTGDSPELGVHSRRSSTTSPPKKTELEQRQDVLNISAAGIRVPRRGRPRSRRNAGRSTATQARVVTRGTSPSPCARPRSRRSSARSRRRSRAAPTRPHSRRIWRSRSPAASIGRRRGPAAAGRTPRRRGHDDEAPGLWHTSITARSKGGRRRPPPPGDRAAAPRGTHPRLMSDRSRNGCVVKLNVRGGMKTRPVANNWPYRRTTSPCRGPSCAAFCASRRRPRSSCLWESTSSRVHVNSR